MLKENKRGDVPITILVIGVFGICSLALFTFFIADFTIGNSFVGVDIMQKMNSGIDEYNFYINNNISVDVVNEFFPTMEENGKKYLYFYKNKSRYLGLGTSNEIAFSVRYPIAKE